MLLMWVENSLANNNNFGIYIIVKRSVYLTETYFPVIQKEKLW